MRLVPALALGSALVLGGCQNYDGSVNWGQTALLGAGIGAGAGLLAAAASDQRRPRYRQYGHYQPRYPGYGGYGYGSAPYGYRGW